MKRLVVLCLLPGPWLLTGCMSSQPAVVLPTPSATIAPVAAPGATAAGNFAIAALPTPTPVPTVDPKVTPTPVLVSAPAVPAAPSPPQSVAQIVSGAFDDISSATTLDQLTIIRGDLATASLNLDQEMRRAEVSNSGSRAAIVSRAQNAIDLALNAARAKYDVINGTGYQVILDNAMNQRSTAVRIASDADAMIADPTLFQRQSQQAASGIGQAIASDAARLGQRR